MVLNPNLPGRLELQVAHVHLSIMGQLVKTAPGPLGLDRSIGRQESRRQESHPCQHHRRSRRGAWVMFWVDVQAMPPPGNRWALLWSRGCSAGFLRSSSPKQPNPLHPCHRACPKTRQEEWGGTAYQSKHACKSRQQPSSRSTPSCRVANRGRLLCNSPRSISPCTNPCTNPCSTSLCNPCKASPCSNLRMASPCSPCHRSLCNTSICNTKPCSRNSSPRSRNRCRWALAVFQAGLCLHFSAIHSGCPSP